MACKADGEVWIPINLDKKNAQKGLQELQNDMAKTQENIEELNKKTAESEEKGVFSKKELEAEKLKLEEMRKTLAEMQSVAKDVTFSKSVRAEAAANIPIQSNEVAEQTRRVRELEAEYKKIERETANYKKQLEKAEKTLGKQEVKAGELAEKLMFSGKATNAFSSYAEEANKRMTRLSKRVKEVVKSALIFSVITKALTEFKEWSVSILKSNEKSRQSIARLKAALLTLAQPIVGVLVPAATKLIDILTTGTIVIARIVAALFGTTTDEAKKEAAALDKESAAIENVGKAAKKAGAQLASFDEINQLVGNSATSASETIDPDFEGLDFDLSNISQKLEDIVVDIETTIKNIRFDWKNGNLAQNESAWKAAISGLLGAIIGASFNGFSGGVIGMLLGVLAGISGIDFADEFANGNATAQTLFAVIGGILGALLGVRFGGLPGGAIGLLLGSLITITGINFAQATNGTWDKNDTITKVMTGILGAILGAAVFGGFTKSLHGAAAGAAIGLLLGALITFGGVDFKNGVTNREAALTNLRAAIGGIMGAILGFQFGGLPGAAIGILMGLLVGFATSVFDDNMSLEAKRQAAEKLFVVLTTIIGAVIGFAVGGGVFGAIVGGVIGLTFGLAITFGDVDVEDLPKNGQLKIDSSGKASWTTTGTMYSVPGLATGTVVPPNREFLALLGDNKTETEIVSPLSTMKQAVDEVMQKYGGTGRELSLRVKAERGLARYLKFELEAEDARQGGKLVTNERLYT